MAKPYKGDWVLRSVLFVPGHMDKMLHKAAGFEADCLVLDLEDAVPLAQKAEAREKVGDILGKGIFSRKTIFVRVNPPQSGLTLPDLEAVACKYLHGFVYPLANQPDDIQNLGAQLRQIEDNLALSAGHFSVIAVCETPLGVLNAHAIATASDRMAGLIFGCEDYLAELRGRHSADDIALHTPRAQIAIAARAAGIEPIDTPYVKVHDLEGLRTFADRGRTLGMAGMCAIAPRQLPVIHEIYTPTDEEIRAAREVIKAAESTDRGVFIAGDKFISPPTLKSARKTIARWEAIRSFEEYSRDSRKT